MDSLKRNGILQIKCISIVLCLVLCILALLVPAYLRAPPTSAQPICQLLEVSFYWKVLFGAHGLSVVRNSEVVHYSGAVNVLSLRGGNNSWCIDCCSLYSRCLLLGVPVNGGSTVYTLDLHTHTCTEFYNIIHYYYIYSKCYSIE